jgi:hypothetical protein
MPREKGSPMSLINMARWATAASALAIAAQANANDFNFYQNGGPVLDETSVTPLYISGSQAVTVRALVNQAPGYVSERWDGLGVTSDDVFNVGEITGGEALVLSFNQAVTLKSLTFAMWENFIGDSFDHATLSWGTNSIALGNNNNGAWNKTFSLANVTGTTFTITATGGLSSFRLAGLSTATAAPVPEASTVSLMGLGLIGLAMVRRRQASKASA